MAACLRCALAVLLWVALAPLARALPAAYDRGAEPAWVEHLTPDMSATLPAEQVAKGQYYLLNDLQIRVEGPERVVYRHVATKALDAQGVESIANLEIRFDPAYQRLTVHAINVRRGSQVIAKLGTATVRVLQRETDLEALIFDGTMTASVVLDDVRVGDVVEYAYSVRGHNPVFGGRQFGRFELQWGVPVARVHARLLWPLGRPLNWRHLNSAPQPVMREAAGMRDYRWDLRNVPGLRLEDDAPAWFDPYRVVHWSEFADWQSVARWAVPLYQLPDQPTPKVRAEIARIAAMHSEPGPRLLEALHFVQREVRYLGVEVGTGSHAPSPPELVLTRRFGDCKDKAQLTLALLHGLGIDAQTALVNTYQRRGIAQWQPAPAAFNHVLVKARVGAQDFWIDPTRSPQKGGLTQLVQSDYGLALLVDEHSSALVPMAGDQARAQHRHIRTVIDSRAGFDKPAQYTVTTVVDGAAAESMRANLASKSRDDLQRHYLNYYAKYYPGVEAAAPIDVVDDADTNRLTLTEHYKVKSFWERSDKNQRFEASIEAPDLLELMRQSGGPVRDSPLALFHPVDQTSVTEVRLPGRWDGKDERIRVDDPAFEFERSEHWVGATLVLTDRFKSRRDHVAATEVGRYLANLVKARQALNYALYHPGAVGAAESAAPASSASAEQQRTRGGDGPHWLAAVLATLSILAFVVLALRVYRWDPAPPDPGPYSFPPPPSGLGGWLILVGFGLVGSVFRLLRTLQQSWPSYTTDTWLALTTPGGDHYHALWAPSLLYALVVNLGLLVGYVLATWLFLKRRSSWPRVYIALSVAAVLVVWGDTAFRLLIPEADAGVRAKEISELIRGFIVTAIWVAYVLRSERVRATFVRRYRAPGEGAAAAPAQAGHELISSALPPVSSPSTTPPTL